MHRVQCNPDQSTAAGLHPIVYLTSHFLCYHPGHNKVTFYCVTKSFHLWYWHCAYLSTVVRHYYAEICWMLWESLVACSGNRNTSCINMISFGAICQIWTYIMLYNSEKTWKITEWRKPAISKPFWSRLLPRICVARPRSVKMADYHSLLWGMNHVLCIFHSRNWERGYRRGGTYDPGKVRRTKFY